MRKNIESARASYFTDIRWWAMCRAHMEEPMPLSKANIARPFVYCREHGVFEVGQGRHRAAMSLLLAFQHDLVSSVAVGEKLELETPYETADYWLQHTEGACFLTILRYPSLPLRAGMDSADGKAVLDFDTVNEHSKVCWNYCDYAANLL